MLKSILYMYEANKMGRRRQQTVTGLSLTERVRHAILTHEQQEALGKERQAITLKLLLLTPRQREEWAEAIMAGNKRKADEILGCTHSKYSIT